MPWEAIVGTATVAGVVAGIVFGVTELLARWDDEDGVPVDERLELIDFEFSADPVGVTVLEYVGPGEVAVVSPYPELAGDTGAESELHNALVLTFRNPSDDPAVLTGLKLVLHEVLYIAGCGSGPGGGVWASLNFNFRFPNNPAGPWEKVNPQNFSVAPHGVDALSVTIGPENREEKIMLWHFSVYGVSTGGGEVHWGDGFGLHLGALHGDLEVLGDASAIDYHDYVIGDQDPHSPDILRNCAADRAATLETFTTVNTDVPVATHPGLPGLIATFREIGER
jgi:hypothetical protein